MGIGFKANLHIQSKYVEQEWALLNNHTITKTDSQKKSIKNQEKFFLFKENGSLILWMLFICINIKFRDRKPRITTRI